MAIFTGADILLPKNADYEKWAVIACDQFTSQPEYWEEVAKGVGDAPSTLHMILPEVMLPGTDEQISTIHKKMESYLTGDVFTEYKNSYIYVERTLLDGSVRKGLVGALDLDQYDYHLDTVAPVRATEATVQERIPPRMRVRRGAPLEMPHVLLLCDDQKKTIVEPLAAEKENMVKVYDFDLCGGGGRIRGWLLSKELTVKVNAALAVYEQEKVPLTYAVGDGNHSLATAKACYEELKKNDPGADLSDHPARFALVELENIHDEAQQFAPIHRVIARTNPGQLLAYLAKACTGEEICPIPWFSGSEQGVLQLGVQPGQLPLAALQQALDAYLFENAGEIDYIHGDDVVRQLSADADALGFLVPGIEKNQFFQSIVTDGILPRKTFSMGHAQEKRYYLEARKIL
ncbi:MAG: DUF1015 domain-containing protein [Ruminococcaceae bacterium]|nr:DUF1015 domain-containing protein [Oscillospiraceae bacterium]